MFTLYPLKLKFNEHKRIVIVAIIGLILMVPVDFAIAHFINRGQSKPTAEQVLGTATQSPQPSPAPTPSPTSSPSPTPRTTRVSQAPTPTPVTSPSPSPSPTSTPQTTSDNSSTQSTPTPTPSPTPTPTPTPAPVTEVKVDYSPLSDRPTDTYSTTVSANQTAWTVIQQTIGISNLLYTDYGGDLGIFITGINGVIPMGNNFWEFKVNGVGASVGVSSYIVAQNDKLEFAISSF